MPKDPTSIILQYLTPSVYNFDVDTIIDDYDWFIKYQLKDDGVIMIGIQGFYIHITKGSLHKTTGIYPVLEISFDHYLRDIMCDDFDSNLYLDLNGISWILSIPMSGSLHCSGRDIYDGICWIPDIR